MISITAQAENRHTPRYHRRGDASRHPAALITTRAAAHTANADTRHTYVSHLTEDGVDRRFMQVQVGHECDSSTAIYTHVSDDFMNTMLKKALSPAFDPPAPLDKEP